MGAATFVTLVVLVALPLLLVAPVAAYCNAWAPGRGNPRSPSSTAFAPGWNGLAKTPFMGWRSWYAFYANMDQPMIENAIDALTARNRTVKGWEGKVSLADLGYASAGIDEGWESCPSGDGRPRGSFHFLNGTPAVNTVKFPSLQGLVDYGHSKGLKMGWYFNGCGCIEYIEPKGGWTPNYVGDIRWLHEMGWDGVKFDGCSSMCNMTEYADLMRQTGKAYVIENCHWGDCTEDDASSCPTIDWCPFNWFRTSGDSDNRLGTWYRNLQSTIKFQDWSEPLSRPSCWAYPDMLQVGRLGCSSSHTQGCPVPSSQLEAWTRTHFAAFAIISSPLVLSIVPSDENLESILDIIGNKLALEINQAWAGHPGGLVRTLPPQMVINTTADVTCGAGTCNAKTDLYCANMTVAEGVAWCKSTPECGGFTLEGSKRQPAKEPYPASCFASADTVFELHFHDAWCAARPNKDNSSTSWRVGGLRPVAGVQLWAKPLGRGKTAALLINGGSSNYTGANISLVELNITTLSRHARANMSLGGHVEESATASATTVVDVWTGEDAGAVVDGVWQVGEVASLDSRFVVFETKALRP